MTAPTISTVETYTLELAGGARLFVRAFRGRDGGLESVAISRRSEEQRLRGIGGGDVSIPAEALPELLAALTEVVET